MSEWPTSEACPEVWADELGCNVLGPHQCRSLGDEPHLIHRCRDCDALVIQDGVFSHRGWELPDASH